MRIELSQLNAAWSILLNHLVELDVKSIDLPQDYYWEIVSSQRYDIYRQPTELVIGQISENLTMLGQMVEGKQYPVAYDLVKLASIIRLIGEMGEAELLKQS